MNEVERILECIDVLRELDVHGGLCAEARHTADIDGAYQSPAADERCERLGCVRLDGLTNSGAAEACAEGVECGRRKHRAMLGGHELIAR